MRKRMRPVPPLAQSVPPPPPMQEEAPPKDYEVGYGRPPRATRFKPGCSGNPKGRPPRSKNIATLVNERLSAQVIVREGGRERKMTKREVGVAKFINRFVETGDPKLLITLHGLEGGQGGRSGGQVGPHAPPAAPQESAETRRILHWYVERELAPRGGGAGIGGLASGDEEGEP